MLNQSKMKTSKRTKSAAHIFLTTSSLAITTFLAAPAHGQALPTGCTPGTATNGAVVECTGTITDSIYTNTSDLTINVGTAGSAATVTSAARGIDVRYGSNHTINVSNNSTVTGGTDGVAVTFAFGGPINVNNMGTVTGLDGHGIYVQASGNSSNPGDINITSNNAYGNGSFSSAINAYVYNQGHGSITISSTGLASGWTGISASAYNGDIAISANNVTGNGGGGVSANVQSFGNISIDTSGHVDATRIGISAQTQFGTVDIDTHTVTSTEQRGISASGYGITIDSTGAISAATDGLFIFSQGNNTTINVTDVTASSGRGIYIQSDYFSEDVSITSTGDINSSSHGIHVRTRYVNDTQIAVNNVMSMSGEGVYVYHGTDGNNINISSTGNVTGIRGIRARTDGAGNTNINANNVTGTTNEAIRVFTSNLFGGDVSVQTTGTVSGETSGIWVENSGSGFTSINAVDVTGTSGIGIRAHATGPGQGLSLTSTGNVSGTTGIDVFHGGGGYTNIDVHNVTGTNATGMLIDSIFSSGVDISSTGTISGSDTGLLLVTDAASSTMSVTNVSGANTHGIQFQNTETTLSNLSIDVSGQVSGGVSGNGILVSGAHAVISLNSGADVSALSGSAIVDADGDATISINDGATVSGSIALGNGSDSLNISSAADITGVTVLDGGDDASSADGFVDELIFNDVVAGLDANGFMNWELIRSNGGDLSLSSLVTERFEVCGGTLTLSGLSQVEDVIGCGQEETINLQGSTVISGDVVGSGATDIITVTDNAEISGRLLSGWGNDIITIDTSGVVNFIKSGHNNDIINLLSGTINNVDSLVHNDHITLDGAVVLGVINGNNGADTIDLISGSANRVFGGRGSDVINLSGAIIGFDINPGPGNDILNMTGGSTPRIIDRGGDNVFNISGGSVSGIQTGSGDDILNITGGTVSGAIRMGRGSDTVTITGGDVSGLTLLDGGDDDSDADGMIDTLTVNNATFSLGASRIRNWENISISDSDVTFDGSEALDVVSFTEGVNVVGGTINTEQAHVGENTVVGIRGGTSVAGSFENQGALHLGAETAGAFDIGGDFTQRQDGSLSFDLNNSSELNVAGTANLAGELNLTGFTEGETSLVSAGALSGTFDEAGLARGLLLQQDISYDHDNGRVSLMGQRFDAGTVSGLTASQQSLANAMMEDLTAHRSRGGLSSLSLQTGSLESAEALSGVLSKIQPQSAAAGLQSFRHSQRLFTQELLSRGMGADEKTAWASTPIYAASLKGTDGDHGKVESFDANTGIAGLKTGPVKLGIAAGYSINGGDMSGEGLDRLQTQTLRLGAHAGLNAPKGKIDSSISYAMGSTEMARTLEAETIGLAELQRAETQTQGLTATAQYTLTDSKLPVQPFVQAGFDHIRQSETQLGQSTAALTLKDYDGSRVSYGIGARYDQDLGDSGFIKLDAYALRYAGDTDIGLTSSFTRAGTNASTFTTDTANVRQQFILDGSAGLKLGTHTNIGVEGFSEFGDITAYGGRVKVGAKF